MWFDSHCHLQLCSGDAAAVVSRARDAGVTSVLTAATDLASSRRCMELAALDGVYAAVGVHPNSATGWNADAAAQLEGLAADPRVAAIGESGLDFYRDDTPRDAQQDAFSAHIDIAVRYDKALVIHTRDSVEAALDVLEKRAPQRCVFHCWSGDETALRRAVSIGAYVSFAGNVTFKSAQTLRDLVRLVPPERLLVETDSPYLSPVPHRGQENEPARAALVGVAVAQILDRPAGWVAERSSANAHELFATGR